MIFNSTSFSFPCLLFHFSYWCCNIWNINQTCEKDFKARIAKMFSWHAGNKKNNCHRLVCANFDSSFQTFWVFWIIIRMVVLYSSFSIVTITLAFYCLPTVNLLVRLVIYFVAYLLPYGRNCLTVRCCIRMKQLWNYIHRVFRMDLITSQESIDKPGRISMKNRFLQLFVILACLLTISSCVLLAMECIVFLVEIVMYTLIGIIINTSQVLIHSSLYHWLFL